MALSDKAQFLIEIFEKSGYEAYQVGGCVRDYLMERVCDDVDITTSATPEETENVLTENGIRYIETGLKHGTVTALVDGDTFEITTFRCDGEYKDGRHPESVSFITNLKDDLSRRDFTINAMAYSKRTGLVDLFGGKSDIDAKIIRTVGNADKRFGEDALRIMRAIRFASVLGFEIEKETKEAVFKNKELLKNVSAERLFTELSKLLMGDFAFFVLMEYREVIAVIIPEITPCFDYPQRTVWHLYDVWEHTCKAVEAVPKDLALRLTMLLHDIGKPFVRTTDEKGVDHFKGHQKVSGEMAEKVLRRFKISNELYDRIMFLIPIHDMHIGTDRKRIKKWLSKVGEKQLLDLVQVKRADKLAQNPQMTSNELANLDITEKLIHQIIEEGEPLTVKDLDINGNDLMALGYHGREIGEKLNEILTAVIDEKIENKKSEILQYLAESN
ncbi:MAG: HD domain-containing protein [Eubacteriales bacterium]|nr:HD domain-containing protein [Eubacteriales bacterium]